MAEKNARGPRRQGFENWIKPKDIPHASIHTDAAILFSDQCPIFRQAGHLFCYTINCFFYRRHHNKAGWD
jgi:hypothetical protein